ncbi:MAG: hypothetical protein R3C11_14920 [Planctomycetaceae bacterium]
MTNIGKVLVILTFFASVIFMGASASLYIGGYNWQEKANDLENYTISPVEGASNRYQATEGATNSSVGGAVTLPKALIAATKDETGKIKSENAELDKRIKEINAKIDTYSKWIGTEEEPGIDVKGLDKKVAQLQAEIQETLDQTKTLSTRLISLTTEANQTLEEAQKRREDIARLKSQLDEIKTEEYRLEEQRVKLVDLLTRYKEIARPWKWRQEQLMQAR